MSTTPSAQDTSALRWFKSSHSTNEGGNCVEVATHPSAVHVRDSKDTAGPQLALTSAAWSSFLDQLRP
jgi:hypothetical protein